MTELYVVRQGNEIIALFPNQQEQKFYCNESISHFTYQKEEWERADEVNLLKSTNIEQFEQIQRLQEENEQLRNSITRLEEEIKRLEKMIWKLQWRFQQEVGIEKAKEHYKDIDKEMKE